ncbi:hypothetical protein [Pseudoduganella namucuonensis]|uniref:Uncharacterized protein n=1 Tax=Pseudoduganella namucuonensis TaxID=1035707 RepID=A0A1I7GRQ6_9BURK|nr:hypothetical protein [Pseudoduganella namucuonensis]SFU51118.1 hypothetical protein SAMN05216552_100456 [Pseudoduganella namucuonensis]
MGCCGSKREQAARNAQAAMPFGAGRQVPAGQGGTGTGGQPGGQAGGYPGGYAGGLGGSPSPGPGAAGVPFVYDGQATLIVTGSATGRRYRFAGRGDRVAVDPRDAPGLMAMEKLRRLAPG